MILKYLRYVRETNRESKKIFHHVNSSRLDFYEHSAYRNRQSGITREGRKQNITISLTTYGNRLHTVHLAIESMLQQTLKPNNIVLWLSEREFGDSELPTLLRNQTNRGLTVKFCEDIGPYKKIIPTLSHFPNDLIVTCDDDIIYPHNHIENLYLSYLTQPDVLHCYRAHKITINKLNQIRPYLEWEYETSQTKPSRRVFPTNGVGTLFFPGALHEDVMRSDLFQSLCPTADDLWLKAMSLRASVRCKTIGYNHNLRKYIQIPIDGGHSLYSQNRTDNDVQLAKLLNFFPELFSLITQDKI